MTGYGSKDGFNAWASDGVDDAQRYTGGGHIVEPDIGENIIYDEMWAELDGGKVLWRLSIDIGRILHGSVLGDKAPIVVKFSNGLGTAGYAKFEYVAIMKGKMILEATELYPASSGVLFPAPAMLVAASTSGR
ncbi:hypothetical protein [Pararhizobium antarcticum]|uniref:Uncharacterized protein n=1 Tax=Pararhizobium antarcticum TaxID=1798805 RepID=A0A657LSW3_9HYPH|nr:hypothetical protein [Pararhizobium antarcticum]OJF97606.1 hypothetical protein AX760_16735 [Pararhizobium antarcticum]